MKWQWAMRLAANDAPSLAGLRLQPGLEVCAQHEEVWLRGTAPSESLDEKLACIPGEHFAIVDDRLLVPRGKILPVAVLPEANWVAIRQWLEPAAPTAALPGHIPQRLAIRLVRCATPLPANALLTTADLWQQYAATAPGVRLRALRFAQAANGQVLIVGSPLPPLPGTRYVEVAGIALPAGFACEPAVDPAVLGRLLVLDAGDIALFNQEARYQRIAAEHFVRARRSAVRMSAEVSA